MRANGRGPARTALVFAVVLAAGAAAAPPVPSPLELRQGTDISVAAAPGGVRVMELAGRLWRLPAEGGDATAITPAGEYARRPAFSPDGSTLAYESLREGHFQVMLADADGGNPRPATSGPWHHLAPAWSADGQRLAVASDRGGDFGIWLLQRDTGTLVQLSFDRGDELDPAWEPNGDGLAYVHEAGGRSALVLRTPTQPRRVLVEAAQRLRAPAWRPDGSLISYVALGPQGGRLNMVILSSPPVVKPLVRAENAFASRVAWLDRQHFLYAADGQLRQRDLGAFGVVELPFRALLDVGTAAEPPARRLADAAGNQPVRGLAGVAPLPNGHVIVSALGDLWELDGDGGLVRALTQDAFVDRDPSASRDGRWLAYTSDRGGRPQVWLMDLASGASRVLTEEAGAAGHPALDGPGGRVAYLAETPAGGAQSLKLVAVGEGQAVELAGGLVAPGTPAWSADGTQIAVIQEEAGNRRLLLFGPAPNAGVRRVTLPGPAAAPGRNEVAWSADGKSLAIGSAAGIRVLPVLASGLAGADWQSRHEGPVQLLRWAADGRTLWFTDADGLARTGTDGATRRVGVALSWRPAALDSGRTVIRAGRLFDGHGDGYRFDQQVVVEGGRIVAVEPWSGAAAAGGTVVDARGKTVMPGLIDLGLQLSDTAGERLGRQLLAFGITTAQVTAAADAELREVAERWRSHAAGPRLLRGAEWCGGTRPAVTDVEVPVGALRLCPALVAEPAPALPLGPGEPPLWASSWLAAGSGAVSGISGISGIRPGAGRPADEALPPGISPYQDAVDVTLRSGAVLVPGLVARGLPVLMQEQPDLFDAPQYTRLATPAERSGDAEAWRGLMAGEGQARRAWLREAQRLVGRFAAGGGRLAAASGAPAAPYGLGLHAELRLLAGAGVPRAAVLRAATGEAARALALQEEIGVVAPGRRADLLVLDGDPLADVGALLRIEAVMIEGSLRPMAALVPDASRAPALEKFTPAPPPAKAKRRSRPR